MLAWGILSDATNFKKWGLFSLYALRYRLFHNTWWTSPCLRMNCGRSTFTVLKQSVSSRCIRHPPCTATKVNNAGISSDVKRSWYIQKKEGLKDTELYGRSRFRPHLLSFKCQQLQHKQKSSENSRQCKARTGRENNEVRKWKMQVAKESAAVLLSQKGDTSSEPIKLMWCRFVQQQNPRWAKQWCLPPVHLISEDHSYNGLRHGLSDGCHRDSAAQLRTSACAPENTH